MKQVALNCLGLFKRKGGYLNAYEISFMNINSYDGIEYVG